MAKSAGEHHIDMYLLDVSATPMPMHGHKIDYSAALGCRGRLLLLGAGVSLVGYVALAVVAAQQQVFGLDYGAQAWVQTVRLGLFDVPMAMVSRLGDHSGLIPLIAIGSLVLWRGSRCWALALPVLMAGAGALQWLAKWATDRPRPDLAPWGFPSRRRGRPRGGSQCAAGRTARPP